MNVCVVGATGAFGRKHLDAIREIEGVRVTAMVSPEQDKLDQLIRSEERRVGKEC